MDHVRRWGRPGGGYVVEQVGGYVVEPVGPQGQLRGGYVVDYVGGGGCGRRV